MQEAYRAYDRGEISYAQLQESLKALNYGAPKEGKFTNFREFRKAIKEPKRSVPQITINLQHQLQCTFDKNETPRGGRRVVTLQDSPVHKNENSYLFSASNRKREQVAEQRDSRLVGNNVYLERKKKVTLAIASNDGNVFTCGDENAVPASPKGVQTYRKNSSSLKVGVGLYGEKSPERKCMVRVLNMEQKGSGDIIKNNFQNKVRPKKRVLLESQIVL